MKHYQHYYPGGMMKHKALYCLMLLVACLSTVHASDWSLLSASGRYSVSIDRQHAAALGAEHRWLFDIKDQNGEPADIAAVDIKGGMPAHKHGLPGKPGWTLDHEQRLAVESLRFHMPGQWFFELRFRNSNGWDSVRVDFEVDATGAINTKTKQAAHTPSMHKPVDQIEWSDQEKAIIASLALPGDNNMNHSSQAVSNKLISLGKQLFADRQLSGNGQTSCMDCHEPDRYFTSDQITDTSGLHSSAEELNDPFERDVMSIVDSARRPWLNWDGRKSELWSHALLPLEIETELGNNRTRIAHYVLRTYRKALTDAFGTLPIDPQPHWPADAGPFGDASEQASWGALSASAKQQINAVFVNVGKALAAYQTQIKAAPGPFDHYAHALDDDDTSEPSLSLSARRGLRLFIGNQGRCINCHNNSAFTNHSFERVIAGNSMMDLGRTLGAQLYLYDEFNCRSPYTELDDDQCDATISTAQRQISQSSPGAFIVPGLRGLEKTAPYMHDGRFTSLDSVISHYNTMGNRFGQADLVPVPDSLSAQDQKDLVAFLLSLGSAYME